MRDEEAIERLAQKLMAEHQGMSHAVAHKIAYEYLDAEYADNLRVAPPGHADKVSEYKFKLIRGCCGSVDKVIYDDENGWLWIYGYNYGH